eukprot:jgi/Chrzof1/14517/Cz09g05220.t1
MWCCLQTTDLSQPLNLDEQLLSYPEHGFEPDVGASLLQLLSSRSAPQAREQNVHIYEPTTPQKSDMSSAYPSSVHLPADSKQDATDSKEDATDSKQDATELITLCRSLPTEIEVLLSHVGEWQFDSFKLSSAANGRPLSLLGFYLISRSELIQKCQLDEVKLASFLMRIEDGYPPNPYHNRSHAADVLRSAHVLVTRGGVLYSGGGDDISLLACYLAAIIHDFEHRGVNNDFLVRLGDPLAILYNDKSPLENHHLAAAFQLMGAEDLNFIKDVPHKTKEGLRRLIIDMVLATDMKQHFAIHGIFQSKLNHNSSLRISGSSPTSSCSTMTHTPLHGGGSKRNMRVSVVAAQQTKTNEEDPETRSLNMQMLLKVADLGHLASPPAVHRQWVLCLEEELFRQGDREKAVGLAVSPLMDRDKHGITKSQVGFFDIVALPLFQTFAQIPDSDVYPDLLMCCSLQKFPESEPILHAVKENYNMWKDELVTTSRTSSANML